MLFGDLLSFGREDMFGIVVSLLEVRKGKEEFLAFLDFRGEK